MNTTSENLQPHHADILKEIEAELKESAFFLGSWDELRKLIDQIEANQKETAYERHTSGGSNAWSGGFAENH